MKILLSLTFSVFVLIVFAQPTQNVRGKVVDSETQFPLFDVKIQLFTSDSTKRYITKSDVDGNFMLSEIPVGKHQLMCTYLTYQVKEITVEVNSGKETIVNIPMVEKVVTQEEVTVRSRKQGQVINEMALISAQEFSVAETDR